LEEFEYNKRVELFSRKCEYLTSVKLLTIVIYVDTFEGSDMTSLSPIIFMK